MLEPVTGIAFSIGVVGFLASTLSNIDEKATRFRECKDRLLFVERQLKSSHRELEAWWSTWLIYEDDDYTYFWGQDGFNDIRAICRSLQELSARIKTLLRRPISDDGENLSWNERCEWQKLLKPQMFKADCEKDFRHQNLGLLRRITYCLFDDEKLKNKVDTFEMEVKSLQRSSRIMFRTLRSGDFQSNVSPEELRKLVELRKFIDRASLFGSSTFESSRLLEEIDSALELSPPGEDENLDWWDELDDLQVDLFMISDAVPKRHASRFRIIQISDSGSISTDVSDLIERARIAIRDDVSVEIDQTSRGALIELECPTSRSRHFRRMLVEGIFTSDIGKSFDVERSNLIYRLAHWFIQFWNTPWTNDLCSCRIRQVHLLDSGTRHSLTAGEIVVRSHSNCQTSEIGGTDRRMLLLGKTLSEIALAVPIDFDFQGEEMQILVNGEQRTRGQLLASLVKLFGRKTITKAIRYCLDPAHTNRKHFLPEHMEPYCQNILQP